MGGTLLNMLTVAIGSLLGIALGDRLPQRAQSSVVTGLGLVTLTVGVSNAQTSGNIIIPLLSVALGVILGELLRIDLALERFGGWLQSRFGGTNRENENNKNKGLKPLALSADDAPDPLALDDTAARDSLAQGAASPEPDAAPASALADPRQRFITGFVTASLVFCIGPLTFLGSLQDGMGLAIGFQQLAIKSTLDFFASIAFAASFGAGVFFSTITVLVVQGGLALIGSVAGQVMTAPMMNEMTATGGLLLIGLSLILLDIRQPRMANFLPALLIAPLIVALGGALGIAVYPALGG